MNHYPAECSSKHSNEEILPKDKAAILFGTFKVNAVLREVSVDQNKL